MRIIVCGGRDYSDIVTIWRELDLLDASRPEPGIRLVIDGASDDVTGPYVGADYWGHQWALARNVPTVRCHAKWMEQGPSAGPIRNHQMLNEQKPDVIVAFPGGRGTADMVRRAKAAKIEVIEIAVSPDSQMALGF